MKLLLTPNKAVPMPAGCTPPHTGSPRRRVWLGILARCALAGGLAAPLLARAGAYDDFFIAVRNDRETVVQTLLARGFDPNTRDPAGTPALMVAVREDSRKVTNGLLAHPLIQVEQRNPHDESALMLAALKGDEALCKRLIELNADVVKTGWTPLHYAASRGHLDVIRLLLEHHAYIDAESPNKTTPLMMAAMYGTEEATRLLLDEGADPTLRTVQGMTAVDFANQAGRESVARLVQQRIDDRRRAAAAARNPSGPTRPAGKW